MAAQHPFDPRAVIATECAFWTSLAAARAQLAEASQPLRRVAARQRVRSELVALGKKNLRTY